MMVELNVFTISKIYLIELHCLQHIFSVYFKHILATKNIFFAMGILSYILSELLIK